MCSAPPTFDPKDQEQRLETFHGQGSESYSDVDLSIAGFHVIRPNLVSCYSCKEEHLIQLFRTSHPLDARWHKVTCEHAVAKRSQLQHEPVLTTNSGSISNTSDTDTPSQHSTYIPPGDVKKEAYRLFTFQNFPDNSKARHAVLARSGFYFTGFSDRVKCFGCGRRWKNVGKLKETDNPADLKWHKPTCPIGKGEESSNIPTSALFQSTSTIRPSEPTNQAGERQMPVDIQNAPRVIPRISGAKRWRMANVISANHKKFLTNLFLCRELDRLASFARWQTRRPNIAPMYLAKSGFFYLGDLDRTQCFSCGGVIQNWAFGDDAFVSHREYFPKCQLIRGIETRNIPIHEQEEAAEEKERKYPCNLPANPHMKSETKRLETFDRRWPSTIAATPAKIAEAGFFFLGERDRAKCWYCNGGLRNWEHDDEPWVEHAKWFPNCQFLLRVKGQHFVYHILKSNAHLDRPIIASQTVLVSSTPPLSSFASTSGHQLQKLIVCQDMPPTLSPTIIDPKEEMKKCKTRVKEIMETARVVKEALKYGFSENIIEAVLVDQLLLGNEGYPNLICESLALFIEDILEKEKELEEEKQKQEKARNRQVSQRPYIKDSGSGKTYMIDTGADWCLLPATPEQLQLPATALKLNAANKTTIHTYGKETVDIMASNGELYRFEFHIAEVDQAIIGADFLHHFKLDVHFSHPRLHDTRVNSYIQTYTLSDIRSLEPIPNLSEMQENLKRIEEERLCKICFSHESVMIFVSCGHQACCLTCTMAVRQCPICGVKIQKAIRVYTS